MQRQLARRLLWRKPADEAVIRAPSPGELGRFTPLRTVSWLWMEVEVSKLLLSVVELGGYPNFAPLYTDCGYEVAVVNSMRKAVGFLKKRRPDVIVAEFNFQSDFRDRTSSLETLMAVVQRLPGVRVIVFYDREFQPQFEKLRARLPVAAALAFPIEEPALQACLQAFEENQNIDA